MAMPSPTPPVDPVTSGKRKFALGVNVRSPLFRKLLASAFLIIAVTVLASDFYLTRYAARREVENLERRLNLEAYVLAAEVADLPAGKLESWAHGASQRAQARVTVIDPQGLVLADSHHDPETMENHANRPEIQTAYQKQVGTSIRHSDTLKRDLCYLAIPLDYRDHEGYVLRLAVPVEDVDAASAAVRWRILGASLAAAFVALGVAYFFSRSFTHRIGSLRAFAEGLVSARFSQTPLSGPPDELGELARSLNSMASQLRELVGRLSLESARREAILVSMTEGVLAVDGDLRITFANESLARALGVRYPLTEKQALVEVVRDPDLREMLTRVLATGCSRTEKLHLSAAPGRSFHVHAAPLAAGSGRGAIAILHDITDLERLENIRKDFVANVSHELRTPLTAIRGYAETLLEGALEDQENNRKFLEIIRAHAIRLNNISSDLLTLSELESGKPAPKPETVSLASALESALRAVEAEARVREVSLVCGKLEEAKVAGDRVQLEQAFVNLLNNAVKFNRPHGEVIVEMIRPVDGRIGVVITDTGIGIPSEHLPRIFERFYRVDKARSRDVGGTGLGLSIVKHVIERMGGTVAVESQLGRGSTFTVLLPTCL